MYVRSILALLPVQVSALSLLACEVTPDLMVLQTDESGSVTPPRSLNLTRLTLDSLEGVTESIPYQVYRAVLDQLVNLTICNIQELHSIDSISHAADIARLVVLICADLMRVELDGRMGLFN